MLVEFPIACIFQPAGFAIVVAEAGDRQVEVPVTVEVACPHVGHSSRLVEDHMRGEILTTIVFKDDDRPVRLLLGMSTPSAATTRSRSPSPSKSIPSTCAGAAMTPPTGISA